MALNHTGTVELETNRLKLRRFVPEDAEMMFANWAGDPSSPNICRGIRTPPPT